jgi:broad specificity phosphatase PhoE
MTREICLVRHGEATNQLNQILCGDGHAPLTEVGKQQAQQLGKTWFEKNRAFEQTYISTVGRCIETVREIEAQGVDLGVMAFCDELREINVGDLSDMKYADFSKDPRLHDFGIACDERFPGGESFREFRERVVRSIKKMATDKKTLVVAHSGVINVVLHWQQTVSWAKYPAFAVGNCQPIDTVIQPMFPFGETP